MTRNAPGILTCAIFSLVILIVGNALIHAETPTPQNDSLSPEKQSLWIEAEDFTYLGGWQLAEKNTCIMGQTKRKKSDVAEDRLRASTKVRIEVGGQYKLWVRAKGGENQNPVRDFSISINSIVASQKLGAHTTDRWEWQSAGVFPLERGETSIELIDSSQYFARCDKILLTTDLSYKPKGEGEAQNIEQIDAKNPPYHAHIAKVIFNDLAPGTLAGQGGGTGFDAKAIWSVDGAINIVDGDLQMPEKNGRSFIRSQSGKPAHINAGSEKTSQAFRPLLITMKGQVWFSYLVKPLHENGMAGINLRQAANEQQDLSIYASGRDLLVKGQVITKRINDRFPIGETSLVLGRIDVNADRHGDRLFAVWVNPDVDQLGLPLFSEKLTKEHSGISHLGLAMSTGSAHGVSPQIDEVTVSNYPRQAGFFHVAPRKRHFGLSHIPVKAAEHKSQLPPAGYNLVFSDEFDAKELDRTKWDYRLVDKDDSAQEEENVEVADGHLIVHARKKNVGKCHFTGGGVISKNVFVYGYYEARFKIPSSEGWHTSFWTMPVYLPMEKRNVEIDFCEQDSGDPNYLSVGLINHRETGWNQSNIGRWVVEDVPNMVEEYVLIGSEYTPEFIRFYVNGRLIKEVDAAVFPHGPATVQLSCIASLKKGDRFQNVAQLPSRARFDYVRVYHNPKYAEAEAAAQIKAVMPTKPIPPISERQRSGVTSEKEGTLD